MKKTVKSILFDIEIDGFGIVNYDGGCQKWLYGKEKRNGFVDSNNNVKYAKRNFYGTDNDLTSKIKISSSCLRHGIFGDAPNNRIYYSKIDLFNYIASETGILRGCVRADSNDSFKKNIITCYHRC